MPQIPKKIRMERAARLRKAGEKRAAAYLAAQVGKILPVLVEKERDRGHTEHFAVVELDRECEPGSMVAAKILGVTPYSLQGLAA